MDLTTLLVQADPVSGGAGWVGAGLLGLVLSWLLLRHLPEKDAQLNAFLAAKDAQVSGLAKQHAEDLEAVITHCREESRENREAAERWHAEQMALLTRIHESSREGVHATRNLAAAFSSRTWMASAMQSVEAPVWTKTLDGTLMSWNAAAEFVLGWRQGEIVGQSIYSRLIPPDQRAGEESVLRMVAAGQPVDEYEAFRVARDGRRVKLVLITSPIRDQAGRVVGASTIAREAVP